MRTSNGQIVCQDCILIKITDDTRHVSNIEELLTSSHILLLDSIRLHGVESLIQSIKKNQDLIIFYSEIEMSHGVKEILFDLKVLCEWLERIE